MMRMKSFSLVAAAVFSALSSSAAQTIAGRLLDEESRAPLKSVDVRLLPDTFTAPKSLGQATTDDAGRFRIQAPSAGAYRLMFGLPNASVLSEPVLVKDKDVEHEFLIDVTAENTYFVFQVAKPAELLPSQPQPQYPQTLREKKIAGNVVVQFVVDTAGQPQMWTLKVLRATHLEFVPAVRSALAQSHFSPAELGGRKVKQLVQMPFEFSLGR